VLLHDRLFIKPLTIINNLYLFPLRRKSTNVSAHTSMGRAMERTRSLQRGGGAGRRVIESGVTFAGEGVDPRFRKIALFRRFAELPVRLREPGFFWLRERGWTRVAVRRGEIRLCDLTRRIGRRGLLGPRLNNLIRKI